MGHCIVCERETDELCVGCQQRCAYLCARHANPCVWCGDDGPYCKECMYCEKRDCPPWPGKWACSVCKRDLKRGGFVERCADCGLNLCTRCALACCCGARDEPPHYVCRNGYHVCEDGGETPDDNGVACMRPTCKRHGILKLAVGRVRLCGEHMREAKKRRKELVGEEEEGKK